MDGDGVMDYFWVDHEGKGWGYLNTGKGKNLWNPLGAIATTGDHDRRKIRMAVLTKSGRADYVVVDDETGAAEWWQNLGEPYNYNWAYRGAAAKGPKNTLESKFGWNTGVADKDHNPEWGLAHLVADGVEVPPRDIQFGDTDGDGLVDYVTVGRVSGKATTWHNLGFQTQNGELSIRWNTPLPFADGTGPGQTVRLAEVRCFVALTWDISWLLHVSSSVRCRVTRSDIAFF